MFFGREELPVTESALAGLLEREPGLRAADLVVVMEPTANAIHAGCLGNVNATWTFHGRSAATRRARGWPTTRSTAPPPGSTRSRRSPPEPREFDGLRFTEVVSVTRVAGGIADNVVPAEAVAHVNYRYAPDRSAEAGRGAGCASCASRTARWASTATPPALRSRSPTRWPSG